MSMEQYAFLPREKVPAAADWQASMTDLGFDLQLDPELTPYASSGFVPCKLGDSDAGFEIYFGSAEELLTEYPHCREQVAPRDYAISFRWSGDMAECASALIAPTAETVVGILEIAPRGATTQEGRHRGLPRHVAVRHHALLTDSAHIGVC